ncbi:hypothetical protein ACFLRW_01860 [Acidobacteriota bacterium]
MNKRENIHWGFTVIPILMFLCVLPGCAVKTANIWGNPETGLILKYQMPEGLVLKYESESTMTQTLDVMGQIQEVEGETKSSTTFTSKGQSGPNHELKATLDKMDMYFASSQGEIIPDTKEAVGKSFEIVLSPSGNEMEFIGIEDLTIDLGPDGVQDLSGEFQDSFPDLSENPVKIGDTWTSDVPVIQTSDNGESILLFTHVYTLESFEEVDGYECVKLSIDTTGTLEGTTFQGGTELLSSGTIKGTGTCYFAYKEGLFIKITAQGIADGTILVSAQNLEIPMSRTYTMESILKK